MPPKRHPNKVTRSSIKVTLAMKSTPTDVEASVVTPSTSTATHKDSIKSTPSTSNVVSINDSLFNTSEVSGVSVYASAPDSWWVNELPHELQVRILSYLRATDLSKVHQVNRYMATNKVLHHDIVVYCSEQVYPLKWTDGFQYQPTTSTPTILPPQPKSTLLSSSNTTNATGSNSSKGGKLVKGKPRSSSFGSLLDSNDDVNHSSTAAIKARSCKSRSSSLGSIDDDASGKVHCNMSTVQNSQTAKKQLQPDKVLPLQQPLYTFEHLRNMELLVVARVLNSPEPTTGYVVSKSWCKTALCWLEGEQERRYEQQQQIEATNSSNKKKKQVKKMNKSKTSRKSHQRASTPPPNINSDITCPHNQLQHCTSTKSARARRRLLDKQAWKILKVLYPESTPIPAQSGECIQCIAETCQIQKLERDQQEAIREQRKLPLQDAHIRRFYTRTRGVPDTCIRARSDIASTTVTTDTKNSPFIDDDRGSCPLIDGTYYVLPRSWCHGWRRFIKSGEGGSYSLAMNLTNVNVSNQQQSYAPPDASCLLCDAHRLALLPPHLESYLYGESDNLFDSSNGHTKLQKGNIIDSTWSIGTVHDEIQLPVLPVGQGPTQESIFAMRSLGLDETEVGRQLSALRAIEARNERLNRTQQQLNEEINTASRNELLDQENYQVVEILSEIEFRSLIGCWPASTSVYVLRFVVHRGIVTTIAATTERDSIVALGQDDNGTNNNDFCISVCRNCDATGRYHVIRGKQRCTRSCNSNGWNSKKGHHGNHDRARVTPSIEY